MKFTVNNNEIIIPTHEDFSAKDILECGQVFRFKKTGFGYEVYSRHHRARLYCHKDHTRIVCTDANYFVNYFDLHTNYANIKMELSKDAMLKQAIEFGKGIRILRQDPLEAIISFIISANNNIPRIKQIIESICQNFGKNMGDYFAFPTIDELKEIPLEFFSKIKAGYRDVYLYETIKLIANGFDLQSVYNMNGSVGAKHLQQLCGVGPKVADCILLFGFYVQDIFPTDTWIRKVYYDYNPGYLKQNPNKPADAKVVRGFFVNKFGKLSGYAQQYLFYAKREAESNLV